MMAFPNTGLCSIDLIIESLEIVPIRAVEGMDTVINAEIRNSGSQEVANFLLKASLYQDGKPYRIYEDVPVLSNLPRSGSGLSVPIKLGKLKKGHYILRVVVDSTNQVREESEINNERELIFKVSSSIYSVGYP